MPTTDSASFRRYAIIVASLLAIVLGYFKIDFNAELQEFAVSQGELIFFGAIGIFNAAMAVWSKVKSLREGK